MQQGLSCFRHASFTEVAVRRFAIYGVIRIPQNTLAYSACFTEKSDVKRLAYIPLRRRLHSLNNALILLACVCVHRKPLFVRNCTVCNSGPRAPLPLLGRGTLSLGTIGDFWACRFQVEIRRPTGVPHATAIISHALCFGRLRLLCRSRAGRQSSHHDHAAAQLDGLLRVNSARLGMEYPTFRSICSLPVQKMLVGVEGL